MTDRHRPNPERVAQYLYKMILRKYNGASEKYKILMQEDQPDRIAAEVEIIRRLSPGVYKKLRSHRIARLSS